MERQYKDSGIEWIGKIPESWEVKRLKNLCTSDTSLIVDGDWIESPDISDEGIRYYTTGNIGDGVFKRQGNGFITESTFQTLNCTPVYPGDLVFSRLNSPIGRSCIIPDDYPICVVAVDNVIVRLDSKYDKRFIMYVSMCPGYQETNMLIARGTTMQRMSRTQLQNVDMPIPLLSEQQRIADYLDEKCGEIDSLIALQEQMIEKLKAYKQSVITEAVTKGLDPNAKLVPSSIDWIGEIPEGWKVEPFKVLFRTGKGLSFTKADLVSEGIPVISYGQVHSKQNTGTRIDDILIRFVPENIAKSGETSKVNIGDFIFADTSEDLSGCGNCVYVDKEIGLYAGYHSVIAFSKRKESNAYLAYLFLTDCWRSQIRCRVSGIKVFSISQSIIKQTSVILPPEDEQNSIVSYLDEKCTDIDHLIALKQKKIDSLKDYKKSVIYEAVTGKTIIE